MGVCSTIFIIQKESEGKCYPIASFDLLKTGGIGTSIFKKTPKYEGGRCLCGESPCIYEEGESAYEAGLMETLGWLQELVAEFPCRKDMYTAVMLYLANLWSSENREWFTVLYYES